MYEKYKELFWIAIIDIIVFILGIAGTAFFDHKAFLSCAVGIIGIVTFFGSLMADIAGANEEGVERIRRSITFAILTVYLTLVGTMAFFKVQEDLKGLLLSFTTTTGVVIAFYFGSSAYVDGKSISKKP
ncbi:hypothetical protein KAW18_13680 [candidate division WOR-3 bacterium]|nr:hypothetical protein [candidate division WOR-3 bacterium]